MRYGECVFLDVGQGTANVIILPNRRAIVLDAGPARRGTLLGVLKRYVDVIECAIISHNDDDHIRGWENVALQFPKSIKDWYILRDRDIHKSRKRIEPLMLMVDRGDLPKPKRAEVRSLNEPLVVWKDDEIGLSLTLLYPDMFANETSLSACDPNRTSAIALLEWRSEQILFPGDSTIHAWRELDSDGDALPIKAFAVAMPHHGGLIGATEGDEHWLYSQAICTQNAIVSVGTANNHKHPRAEILSALKDSGAKIICTQITKQCHSNLEQLRPGVLSLPLYKGDSRATGDFTQSGRSRNVACAGSIVIGLNEDGMILERASEHTHAVSSKVSQPLCR